MCSEFLYPFVKHALGTLYPAYKTWKALKRKDETTRRRWMKYWISFAAFQTIEPIADITIIFITPFYFSLKILLITWLVYGTKIIYDSIVNRELAKREKAIDKWLNRIYKFRDELIALMWFEMSRCSVRIITALMSGGLSVLVKSHPDHSESCYETSPPISIDNVRNTIDYNKINNNNNEISYRRSKRIVKIEEVANDYQTDAMDTGDSDDEDRTKQQDVTVEYVITQE